MRWKREILKRRSRLGLAQYPDAQQPAQVTAQGRDHKAQQNPPRDEIEGGEPEAHIPQKG